jgi:L-ascorbate metabolism protein UlaG (beta-lactamase superfamily)
MVVCNGLTFERLGHASVRIETGDGSVIYIDPWSQVLETEPHDADTVFVTHDDRDHYDAAAITAVATAETTVGAYEAVDTADLDYEVTPLADDVSHTVDGIEVRTVPAYNQPDGDHVDENGQPFHADDEVIGLLLTIDGTTVYFPSDTDFLEGHAELTADVVMPPIGGHFTMDRHTAARFVESVDPALVLPVHYDTFDAIETDAEAFKEEVEASGSEVVLF